MRDLGLKKDKIRFDFLVSPLFSLLRQFFSFIGLSSFFHIVMFLSDHDEDSLLHIVLIASRRQSYNINLVSKRLHYSLNILEGALLQLGSN